jgi:hypothetical protein
MPHSQHAFSAPSKQTLGSNPKGNLNSIASISALSTISIPSSGPSAPKPRDSTLKREQNPRYSVGIQISANPLKSLMAGFQWKPDVARYFLMNPAD